jgi:two-component system sensor histidine kinase RpfC
MDDCLTKPIEPERLLRVIVAHVPDAAPVAAVSQAVTEITSHPRFRPASGGAIDAAVLADLESLGGKDFVVELIESFLADSRDLVAEMTAAAAAHDSSAFRSHAHALRSAAANIGAKSLFELCLSWRLIRSQELDRETEALIPRLNAENERVRAQLLAHRARLAANVREG